MRRESIPENEHVQKIPCSFSEIDSFARVASRRPSNLTSLSVAPFLRCSCDPVSSVTSVAVSSVTSVTVSSVTSVAV